MPGPGQGRGTSALFDPSMPELTGQDPSRGEAEIKDAHRKIFDTGKLTPPDSEFLPTISPDRATPGQNWTDLNTSARALDTFPRANSRRSVTPRQASSVADGDRRWALCASASVADGDRGLDCGN